MFWQAVLNVILQPMLQASEVPVEQVEQTVVMLAKYMTGIIAKRFAFKVAIRACAMAAPIKAYNINKITPMFHASSETIPVDTDAINKIISVIIVNRCGIRSDRYGLECHIAAYATGI
jgi:hypothetical protein